ncbi:MAG: hypothetical protein ACYTF7_07490 [Planctomycetota bacterium]|jgi:hypothetical protein
MILASTTLLLNGIGVVIATLGVALIVLVQLKARKRASEVSLFADGVGASFKPKDSDLDPGKAPLRQFELGLPEGGGRGVIRNVSCVDLGGGQQMWIGDHYLAHPIVASLSPKGRVRTIALVSMGTTRLPQMIVCPRDEAPVRDEFDPWREVALENAETFTGAFEARSMDSAGASAALTEQACQAIEWQEDMWIETSGPWMVLYRRGVRCDKAALTELVAEAQVVRNGFVDTEASGRIDHQVDLSSMGRQVA